MTEWILDDGLWTQDQLDANQQVLIQGVVERLKRQNWKIRSYLASLGSLQPVNPAVFVALDRFDAALSGHLENQRVQSAVLQVFSDFSAMASHEIRKWVAGGITGPLGTETRQVDVFGYMNCLKDFDAAVQWAIFMPSVVEQQQNGFTVESFEYRKMPAVRFIGKELRENGADSARERSALFRVLDEMSENRSGFDYNLLFEHHYGKGVDVEPCHGFWGRFMKAGTPVPDGFLYFDLIPSQGLQETEPGPPFFSQFAFAVFTGDQEAMHRRQGFDSSAMYDITRNIILGQGVGIPYPDKYWTAEVFLNGFDRSNSAYLFCAEL